MKAKTRGRIILAAGVLAAAVLLWVALSKPQRPGPPVLSGDREGAAWTVDELFDHLKAKGVVDRRTDANRGVDGGPSQHFHARGGEYAAVQQCHDPSVARGAARDRQISGEAYVFAWGRFLFDCDRKLGEQIQAALR